MTEDAPDGAAIPRVTTYPGHVAAPTRPARSATPITGALLTSAAVLLAALAVLLTALALGGGLAVPALGDPGALVRYGLPIARTVHDLSAALAVGGFAVATCLLPHPSDAWTRAVRVAGVAAGVWAVAALLVLVLTAMDVIGVAVVAVVLVLLPAFVDWANVFAGLGGAAVGAASGLVANLARRPRSPAG